MKINVYDEETMVYVFTDEDYAKWVDCGRGYEINIPLWKYILLKLLNKLGDIHHKLLRELYSKEDNRLWELEMKEEEKNENR